ncbi:MAG: flagellar biosynthetic protein FliR [Alphaproteobacteria bacterium PA2]|nr:MAG: flagellar biosynthetic protein FliR [Alphaproteobacteria bacterium PA2]
MEPYATTQQIYAGALIFARLASLVMTMPGVGDASVPPRIRLSFAFVMTLALTPVIAPVLPAIPPAVSDIAGAVIKEVLVGLMIGTILRLFLTALATAGEIVSIQTTLSFAQTSAPGIAPGSTTLGTFLGLIGLVLIMTTDLHHMFIAAIVRSYAIFPFTRDIPVADAGELAVQTVSQSFKMGLQLSAPVAVFGLIFNIAIGLIGRVMPQFQVYFVASPLMVLFGLSIFAITLGVVGLVWVDGYRVLIRNFAG